MRHAVRSHRANRVRGPWTAGMATVSSSARAVDAHAAWGDSGESQPSSRLTSTPSATVESGAACPDRLRTRLPPVARACRVQRPAAATCPVLSPRLVPAHRQAAARRLAQRAVETAVSVARKTARSESSPRSGGIRPIGGVARDAAPSCAGAATTLSAAAAQGGRAARGFSGRRPRLAKRDVLPPPHRRAGA